MKSYLASPVFIYSVKCEETACSRSMSTSYFPLIVGLLTSKSLSSRYDGCITRSCSGKTTPQQLRPFHIYALRVGDNPREEMNTNKETSLNKVLASYKVQTDD